MKSVKKVVLLLALAVASAAFVCTTPPWFVQAENIAKVSLPIVQGILDVAVPQSAPVVNQVVADINLLIGLFDKYQAAPSTGTLSDIQNALNTVNADLAKILPAAHITDPKTAAKVTAIVQLVQSEFSQIASILPSTTARAGVRVPTAKTLSVKDFKSRYNAIVAGDAVLKPVK